MTPEARARVEALAVQFAMAIVEAVADASAPATEYRTKGPRARGVSARLHNTVCRSGRVKHARKIGREWVCSVDAWNEARATKAAPSPDDEDIAMRALLGTDDANVIPMRPTKKAL